jgi:2-haloacid dehalogenase
VAVAAVVFDLYGTILTIESMGAHVAAAGVPDAAAFVADWRRKQLEYAFLTTLAQAYRDFDELTALALDFTCAQRDTNLDADARAQLVAAWQTMPAYDDVAPALRALAERDIPRAVLTNGTPSSARTALRAANILDALTDVLSVDAVRAFKPDPRVYALATARFGCTPNEIVFVSSNPWDAWGAAHFGFRVAWCNRHGQPAEALAPPPAAQLRGLDELAAFVWAPDGTGTTRSDDRRSARRDALNEDADAGKGDIGRSTDEPALTERNTETIRGEAILAGDEERGVDREAAAYGQRGGTTDATEEGGDGTDV